MLVEAAAKGWGVAPAECRVEKGVITHAGSGRTTTFGAVAAEAAKVAPPKDIVLKDPKDWTIAGKPVKRLDTVEKTDGSQVYGIDLKMPGMLNAAIRDCPVFGGTVKSFDAKAVEGMPGVKKVVRGRRFRRGGHRRHVLARQDGGRGPADRLGRGPEREGLERDHRRDAARGARRGGGLCRQQGRRRRAAP